MNSEYLKKNKLKGYNIKERDRERAAKRKEYSAVRSPYSIMNSFFKRAIQNP